MDSRQSDNSIVPLIASNAEGGKGVAKGYISARNLHRTQGRMNGGKHKAGRKLSVLFMTLLPSVLWGARCRKAARRDLLGACLVRGTSTNQSRTHGSVRG